MNRFPPFHPNSLPMPPHKNTGVRKYQASYMNYNNVAMQFNEVMRSNNTFPGVHRPQPTEADTVHAAAMALISIPSRASNEISNRNVRSISEVQNKRDLDEARSRNLNNISHYPFQPMTKIRKTCDVNETISGRTHVQSDKSLSLSCQTKQHNYPEESSVVTRSSTSSLADNIHDDVSQDSTLLKSDSFSQVKLSSSCNTFIGSVSLALPEDKEVLSPLHCFMRRYCIEAFTVNEYDTNEVKGANRLRPGMVGIRCVHCKNRPTHERAERAVCYPSSVKNIYYSMETWQRRHATVCRDIPEWVKKEMANLIVASKSCAGGRRQYWADAALKIGMIDTPDGIRFSRHPESVSFDDDAHNTTVSIPTQDSSGVKLVTPQDKFLITSHLYLLMSQMEPCTFTEEDRTGGRSKIKTNQIGYPGIQCRHCSGKAGFGRYFPTSAHSLTLANSDRNIFNHMMKCRTCPNDIKEELKKQRERRQSLEDKLNNRRGSRKKFFTRVWEQLHGKEKMNS